MTAELAAASRGRRRCLNFLPRPIRSRASAACGPSLIAWLLTSIRSASLLVGAVNLAVFPDAAQPEFDMPAGLAAVSRSSIFAPVVETLIMGGVLLILLRLLQSGRLR